MIRRFLLGVAGLVCFSIVLTLALSNPGKAAMGLVGWVVLAYLVVRALPGIRDDLSRFGFARRSLSARSSTSGRLGRLLGGRKDDGGTF